jgi:hypothetical protein
MRYAFLPKREGAQAAFWSELKASYGPQNVAHLFLNESGVIVFSNNGGVMPEWDGVKYKLPDEAEYSTLTDGGISGWDVPDRDEARLIFDARGSICGLTHASYLCENSGYKCFRVGSSVASFSATAAPTATSDTALRAVATVTIAKE